MKPKSANLSSADVAGGAVLKAQSERHASRYPGAASGPAIAGRAHDVKVREALSNCDMSEFEAEIAKSELSKGGRRSRFEGAERFPWPVTRPAPLMAPPQLDETLMRKRERW